MADHFFVYNIYLDCCDAMNVQLHFDREYPMYFYLHPRKKELRLDL